MGYEDKDDPMDEAGFARSGLIQTALGAVVRLVGLALLLVGLWVGVKIVLEAWALYEDPSRIVRFAEDIQANSNLDGVIGSLAGGEAGGAGASAGQSGSQSGSQSGNQGSNQSSGLRLSYFAAWFIVLLLMFVIGSLSMAAITTGGQLVLYDLQVKHHSRAVLREVQRLRRSS